MDTSILWEYAWTHLICGSMYGHFYFVGVCMDTSNLCEYVWTLLICVSMHGHL